MKSRTEHKRWTKEEIEYVRQNLGKKSLEAMALALGRTPMSVRLYIFRKRLSAEPRLKRNLLMTMLEIKFRHPEDFNPTKAFFQETGISLRRYWDMYFGRRPITWAEYAAIAEYLGVTIQDAFEARQLQLDLFEEQ